MFDLQNEISTYNADRFWRRVAVTANPEKCWEWRGGKWSNNSGYGRVKIGPKYRSAHRLAYALASGAFPSDLCVCHRCDNRICVNPSHLFLGTHQDNHNDMDAKGRRRPASGERCALSKLSEVDVRFMRANQGALSVREMAEMFRVTSSCIGAILSGKTWRHVLCE